MGRGHRPLPAQPRGARPSRRVGRGRGHGQQHRGDPVRSGPARRGGGASCARAFARTARPSTRWGSPTRSSTSAGSWRAEAARRRPATCSPRRSTCGSRSAVRPARPRPRRSWPRRCCSKATTPAALAVLGPAVERGRQLAVVPWLRALLQRLLGSALVQAGDREAGIAALHEAVSLSRASGSQFELAMGLDALARLHPGTPEAASGRHEADEVFDRLGVIGIARIPLPASV